MRQPKSPKEIIEYLQANPDKSAQYQSVVCRILKSQVSVYRAFLIHATQAQIEQVKSGQFTVYQMRKLADEKNKYNRLKVK